LGSFKQSELNKGKPINIKSFSIDDLLKKNLLINWLCITSPTKKFKKKEEELSSQLDYWLYVLNNLPHLTDIPEKLENNEVMQRSFLMLLSF